jgi:phosphopantothenoylcysteine decarboxylase/phosphopantothenate--cysteine ligase
MKKLRTKATRFLITAGPTREYIDPVRYISNDSSGRMGFSLAKAAHELGGDVTLIAGPVGLETPEGVRGLAVTNAIEMHRATLRESKNADIIIMAAAVTDWRPKGSRRSKIKKGKKPPKLELVENPDILSDICKKRRDGQTIVGFALETADLERNARRKLKKKGCDWIVANKASAIGACVSKAILIGKDGKKVSLPKLPKEDLAVVILSHVMC